MIPVENSSNISHIGFDPETNNLKVLYSNGGTYHYKDVQSEHWANIQAAMANGESVGKYLHAHIKGVYEFEKIPVDG